MPTEADTKVSRLLRFMTALATSPNFEGACGLQSTAESGPLFLLASGLVHTEMPDIGKVQRGLDELLGKL